MKMRWIAMLALGCAVPIALLAQPPRPDAGVIGIAHIAFRVSDLDREIAFFGKLGYEKSFTLTNSTGQVMEMFVKINDRQFIELYPQTNPQQPLGWMHVCYEVGDLNALYKFYDSTGLKLLPVRQAGAGNLISAINDPEGRVTEFAQYMPGSKYMLDEGQHLGPNRVSTELMGFDLPVKDGAADKEFYADLGFEANEESGNVRLSAPAAPDLHIELRAARPKAQPQFLFPVADARRTEQQLRNAGLNPVRDDKLVFIHDPDDNIFVFLELPRNR
jgi:catechol 2,3-dioxygenase-like lactoylglutathione lyase family enzyme